MIRLIFFIPGALLFLYLGFPLVFDITSLPPIEILARLLALIPLFVVLVQLSDMRW